MPCNADYMNPNESEVNSNEVAKHIVFVSKQLKKRVHPNVRKAAKDIYGNPELLDRMTAKLCSMLKGLSDEEEERIIYNAKDKNSRRLADWWETHQEADKDRIAEEKRQRARHRLRRKAISKIKEILSDEELESLDLEDEI